MDPKDYVIEDEFFERVKDYSITALSHTPPLPLFITANGAEYGVIDREILYVKDLSFAQIALFIKIAGCIDTWEFGDLLDWTERPEDRQPELLDQENILKLLLDMEQKGYITMHAKD